LKLDEVIAKVQHHFFWNTVYIQSRAQYDDRELTPSLHLKGARHITHWRKFVAPDGRSVPR